jgi:hypothetical protein
MFPLSPASTLAQRALGALRLTRSFLLLEDDREVDWEVDQDGRALAIHPHRAVLRGRLSHRRPGQPAGTPQVCLCPLNRSPAPAAPRQWRARLAQAPQQGRVGTLPERDAQREASLPCAHVRSR